MGEGVKNGKKYYVICDWSLLREGGKETERDTERSREKEKERKREGKERDS